MSISTQMIVRIAHADIALHMAFPRSVDHWQREEDQERPWKVLAGDCGPVLIGKNDGVVIDGNCSNGLSAPDGGAIHIYGDLACTIDVAGHYEIVVTGDVLPKATIQASGFCRVFVGGGFYGQLCSTDSAKLWIESNFDGIAKTGNPSTEIYIGNDYKGTISPSETASLLWLTVGGFASHASLAKIVAIGYTQFNASIARSDVPPGIYPTNGHVRKTSGGNSHNRWSVQTEYGT
jgi:hypothetical protein